MKISKRLFKKVVTFTVPAVIAAQMAVTVPAVAPVMTYAAVAEVGFDNSVSGIPDGTYSYPADENVYVSGGGRHAPAFNVKSISVSGGKATATISLTSGTYEYVTVSDDLDDLIANYKKDVSAATGKVSAVHPDADHSEFTIPVKLGEDMRLCGWSSSVESWISPYVINISLNASTLTRTVKRTIHFADETGESVSPDVVQEAVFTRVTITSGKEGIKEEKDWNSEDDLFEEIKSPAIEKMTPDKETVEAEKADPETENKEVTVTYKKNETNNDNNGDNGGENNNNGQTDNGDSGSTDDTGNDDSGNKQTDPDGDPDNNIDNGSYDVSYKDAESKRFNVKKVVLHVENGKYTADITLGGTGYGYVYPGTSAEAEAAGEDNWSPYTEGEDGAYTYTIEVPVLNMLFPLASRSIRDGVWYDADHEIIIYSKDTQGNELPTHSTEDITETESKILTRTVKFVDENGERLAADVVQAAIFNRTKTTSGVDGSVTDSEWEPEKLLLDPVAAAQIPGMEPDKTEAEGYTFSSSDTDNVVHTITYKKSEINDNNGPENNSNDSGNENNDNNENNENNENNNDNGENKATGDEDDTNKNNGSQGSSSGSGSESSGNGHVTSSAGTTAGTTGRYSSAGTTGVTGTTGSTAAATGSTAPGTGDKNPAGAWIALGAAAVGGAFAAVFARKRQRR